MVLPAKILCVFGKKIEEEVMGRSQKIGISFSRDLADHAPQQADWALRRHWTGYRRIQAQADNAH